ncbi:MAG: hypothetical protein ACLU8D_09945 [Enterocloster sp.]
MDWQMKVVCGEKEQALENLLKENVEKVVDEAFKRASPQIMRFHRRPGRSGSSRRHLWPEPGM